MKKMNRSQSSYRNCKTLITEEDSENHATKYGSRPQPSKANLVNSSMAEPNKENSYLFQSVSERQFNSKSRNDLCELQNPTEQLRRRCSEYEQQIRRLYQERERYASQRSSPYNYSEQFYIKQNEELKKRLQYQGVELQQLRESVTQREQSQVMSEVSVKLQRDQKDKNLFVKELNHRNIEIINLQERNKLQRGEIDTLKLYLQEKTQRVGELEEKLGQVDMRKRKLEQYESKIKESHDFLKDLEMQTQKLKEETEAKDGVIFEKSKSIAELEQTINSYEDKLRAIEQSLLGYSQERKGLRESSEKLGRQNQQWRQSYQQLLQKSEGVQQMEMQLRTYTAMVEDLNRKNMELTSANQQFRITCSTLEKNTARLVEIQRDGHCLRKELKEREERIIEFQGKEKAFRHLEECYAKLRKEKDETLVKLNERVKENKQLALQLDEALRRVATLEEEIGEIEEENSRTKERGEKIDLLMKENNRLNSVLMDKVNDIEKLQFRINHLESKFTNANSEAVKQKAVAEQRQQQIREMEVQIDDIRTRYEAETNSRIQVEDRLVRSNQEILALRFAMTKLEQENEESRVEIDRSNERHEEEVRGVRAELVVLESNKRETEEMLKESKGRLDVLRKEVDECKWSLEEAENKEREHFQAIGKLQNRLTCLQEENSKLRESNSWMGAAAVKIKELSELMLSRQTV